jgi:hypothetical protein
MRDDVPVCVVRGGARCEMSKGNLDYTSPSHKKEVFFLVDLA